MIESDSIFNSIFTIQDLSFPHNLNIICIGASYIYREIEIFFIIYSVLLIKLLPTFNNKIEKSKSRF